MGYSLGGCNGDAGGCVSGPEGAWRTEVVASPHSSGRQAKDGPREAEGSPLDHYHDRQGRAFAQQQHPLWNLQLGLRKHGPALAGYGASVQVLLGTANARAPAGLSAPSTMQLLPSASGSGPCRLMRRAPPTSGSTGKADHQPYVANSTRRETLQRVPHVHAHAVSQPCRGQLQRASSSPCSNGVWWQI